MLEHERLACLVSGASTCALSEWDGFQITFEPGGGRQRTKEDFRPLPSFVSDKTSLHLNAHGESTANKSGGNAY